MHMKKLDNKENKLYDKFGLSTSINSLNKSTKNTLSKAFTKLLLILLFRNEFLTFSLLELFNGFASLKRSHSLLALLETTRLVRSLLTKLRSEINLLRSQQELQRRGKI